MTILSTTSLREVYETHMRYIADQDIEGLVHDTYTDDAVLVHNFPYFPGPGPYRHEGKQAIIEAQRRRCLLRTGKNPLAVERGHLHLSPKGRGSAPSPLLGHI